MVLKTVLQVDESIDNVGQIALFGYDNLQITSVVVPSDLQVTIVGSEGEKQLLGDTTQPLACQSLGGLYGVKDFTISV